MTTENLKQTRESAAAEDTPSSSTTFGGRRHDDAGLVGEVADGVDGALGGLGSAVGAVAGGLVGSSIGKSLDDEERRQLALASELAAEQPVVKSAPPKKVQWKRTDPQTSTARSASPARMASPTSRALSG